MFCAFELDCVQNALSLLFVLVWTRQQLFVHVLYALDRMPCHCYSCKYGHDNSAVCLLALIVLSETSGHITFNTFAFNTLPCHFRHVRQQRLKQAALSLSTHVCRKQAAY
jgi:hypothetical protein